MAQASQSRYSIDSDWDRLYIGGEWRESAGGETIPVEDPSTREKVTTVPRGTDDDVNAAYDAAVEAQDEWRDTSPARREELVRNLLRTLEDHSQAIVELLATEGGGTRGMGQTSVHLTVDQIAEAQTLPRRMKGDHATSNIPGKENLLVRKPCGVVTVISPWNYPLNLSARAVVPAVAAGNTVVLKPATNTPVVGGLLFARLFEDAGFPPGVLNVVTGRGSEIGDAVASHDASDVVSFTGSTAVGRRVAAAAGENLAEMALELGGNNAHIVTAEADLDAAIDAAVFGSFTHQGQVCISINRHLVHEDVYDEYVEKLTERVEALPVGSAHDPDTVIGPIIDESQRDEMLEYVERTVEAGATVETGGGTVALDDVEESLVVEPTVLSGVTNDMPTACNEHFGPIAPVIPFADVDEAVELANATEYGLSGSVHAGDVGTGSRIARRLETGMVHVNDQPINDEAHVPFGGTGASGVGGYNTDDFLDEVTETKWISLQHEPREYPF
ncbi:MULTISPECIES: aldehyde dehydrogenase family protein [unclassified Haladaptatus]|uniref:aldehyde dehydrogenase family protein n=1 Tax=unclassified Haladaptatus TaxID=2622732 RepID=UPI00209BE73F|nr:MULTISPECIES: aldehyde dehydrogenase family protein [unclassified Haladaptatus]MCO8243660.1 aldehyde dehydrogenase family protein [Haladaptatus sp. AB643]MCO8255069.1 aldehyde dehydrogenase family protein [Haladaptatus sp. AB618]